MFERYTDRARRIITLANNEAKTLGSGSIGTEHLFLGLIAEGEGVGLEVLKALGLDLIELRKQVVAESAGAHVSAALPKTLPFAPGAKKVLELSLREALTMGHNYIGTEHLLLGLIREGDGIAARILVTYVGLDDARSETIKIIGDKSPANTGRPGMPFLRKTSFSQKPATGEMQKSPTTPILEQLADLQRRVTALESTVGEEGAE